MLGNVPGFPLLGQQMTTPFSPASPQAKSVFDLFVLTGIIMLVILVIVCGWVGYILLRYRARPEDEGQPDPDPVFGNKKLEITWTVIPFLIIVLLTALMVPSIGASRPQDGDRKPDIIVIGHQWWWEVIYPDRHLVTANEVHVPVGRPVLLHLKAADVVHDFWVPQLGPKEDMIPTETNHIWLEPAAPGVYDGACAEFCGNDHAWMRIRVIAQAESEFEAWQTAQLRPAPASATADAQRGQMLFEQNTCRNCHALAGAAANGPTIAPDLTNLADRQTLGAGTLVNSLDNLTLWMTNPQRYKPGCYMPDFHFSSDDAHALAAYLWRKAAEVPAAATAAKPPAGTAMPPAGTAMPPAGTAMPPAGTAMPPAGTAMPKADSSALPGASSAAPASASAPTPAPSATVGPATAPSGGAR